MDPSESEVRHEERVRLTLLYALRYEKDAPTRIAQLTQELARHGVPPDQVTSGGCDSLGRM